VVFSRQKCCTCFWFPQCVLHVLSILPSLM
jgi:predicted RecB family nuclease